MAVSRSASRCEATEFVGFNDGEFDDTVCVTENPPRYIPEDGSALPNNLVIGNRPAGEWRSILVRSFYLCSFGDEFRF
jgi:hypothetical protein